jgi:aminoglycoside phosphotransferase family enzyme/predicted kinase
MPIPAEQAATAAMLQALAGHAPVETHISAVFLGQDSVWKLRKAVRLSFLDFSSLAERHRTALREVELNAGSAPGLYKGVVPITRGDDGLTCGGTGKVVDWVVCMARVPAEDFLDRITARGAMTPALLDQLGDGVAALHAGLAPVPRDLVAAMRGVVTGNLAAALSAGLDPAEAASWHQEALAMIDARADWLAARGQGGFVRRAHGDLHLGNLCLWQGRPVPFDALEFDEDLATIDLGYDLAFLLMDLEQVCGRAAANRVLNRYVARTGDVGLVAGLPLYLSLRALIRAHVQARSGQDPSRYMTAARALLHPPPARAMAIGGLPGTGKSTLARRIAPDLGPAPGALILRSDECRKRRFGVAPEQALPEAAYAAAVSREVMEALMADFAAVARSGHGVIADATFLSPTDRTAPDRAAGPVACRCVWLEAPLTVLSDRVTARTGDASDADAAILARAAEKDCGVIGWERLDTTDKAAIAAFVETVTQSCLSC